MPRRESPSQAPPPVLRLGYAVFVKLWDVSADVSADFAFALFSVLDNLLLALVKNSHDNWFPSPYGGAVVVFDVETALRVAKNIISETAKQGIAVSIGIAYGHFDRVHNVTRWNTAALAMNLAARIASNPETKGQICVEPKIKNDATAARKEFDSIFGPSKQGQVKRTSFEFYEILNSDYVQRLGASLKLPNSRKRTRLADVVLFDIEKYSEKPQDEQTRLADSLSKCVEFALASIGAKPNHFGPAGDGGYLAFVFEGGRPVQTAWPFVRNLREQANRENIPIRIGIANGPMLSTAERPIIGGVVLRADLVSSFAPTGELAVTTEFWDALATQLRSEWAVASKEAKGSVLILRPPSGVSLSTTEIDSVLTDAPPIVVRTVLFTLYNKQDIEIPLNYFQEQGIKVIATPNTGAFIKSLGFNFISTFEYTQCAPLFTARGTLHPYILMSIATGSNDEERLTALRKVGLDSIDLVLVNTIDPIISKGMGAAELMEQVAGVQLGGPSLVRWTLKQWRTAAAVVHPEDYSLLVADLHKNQNRLSARVRLAFLRRAMEYLAIKDKQTSDLFQALWHQVD